MASGMFFLIMAATTVMDIYNDGQDNLSRIHIIVEFFTLLLSIAAAIFFSLIAYKITKDNQSLYESVKSESEQKEHYKRRVMGYAQGLSSAIEDQFRSWGLTHSEKEIGFLILKGLSTKEISQIQFIQDKTVRHHCSSIYKKSGLSGRSELSAYFLEDLLITEDQ